MLQVTGLWANADGRRATPTHASPSVGRFALPGLAAVFGFALLRQGGFYRADTLIIACAFALLALAVSRGGYTTLQRKVLVGLTILAGGLGLSIAMTAWPAGSVPALAVFATAVAAYLVGVTACRIDGADSLLELIVALATVTAAVGIYGVATRHPTLAEPVRESWRLAATLGYSNAAAALLAMSLGPAIAAVHRRRDHLSRVALTLIVAALFATMSRGGLLAAGVAVGFTLHFGRIHPRLLLRSLVGAGIAFVALLPSMTGPAPSPAIAGLGVVAGCCIAATSGRAHLAVGGRPRVQTAAAVGLLGGLGVALFASVGSTAVLDAGDTRLPLWSLGVEKVAEGPVFGTGLGTLEIVGVAEDRPVVDRYAHNEYLQALVETGVAGLAAIGVALALFASAAWRARPGVGRRVTWAAACAGGVAFAAHSSVDFLWRFPVLVAVAFVLLAAVLGTAERKQS